MADKNINSSPEAVTVDKEDYLFLSKDGTNLNKVLVSKVLSLVDLSTYAPKASPSFSGTPTAPNPSSSANSQQIATTKWVRDLLSNVSTSISAATSTTLGGIKAETADDSYTVEVKIDQATSKLFVPTYPTGAGGTSSYSALSDKPQINGITLSGNKDLSDLGIQPAGNYLTSVPKATSSVYGGIKASEKGAGDTVEVKQDNSSGKLYVPTYPSLSGYAPLNAPTFSNPKTNAPASSSNDTSIPNTQWVRTLVDNKLIPVGGLAGQALVKKSGSDYDVEWATVSGGSGGTTNYNALSNRPSINDVTLEGSMTADDLGIYSVPTGGSTGQVLKKTSNDAGGYEWADETGGGDVDLTGYAKLASPTFTGTPKAPTAATSTNTTQIATTAFVKAQGYATLASPTFTGIPKAPNSAKTDDSTRIATTSFVKDVVADYAPLSGAELADAHVNSPSTDSNDTSIPNTMWVNYKLSQLDLGGGTGSGGGYTVDVLIDMEVEEDNVKRIDKTISTSKYDRILVYLDANGTKATNTFSVYTYLNGETNTSNRVAEIYNWGSANLSNRGWSFIDFYDCGYFSFSVPQSGSTSQTGTNMRVISGDLYNNDTEVTQISLSTSTAGRYFEIGTIIKVYGVKAGYGSGSGGGLTVSYDEDTETIIFSDGGGTSGS